MRPFLIGIFTVLCGSAATKAQDVYLSVPESNIFNRSEFTSVPTRVMTNANRTNWDYAFWDYSRQLLHLPLFRAQFYALFFLTHFTRYHASVAVGKYGWTDAIYRTNRLFTRFSVIQYKRCKMV